MPATITISDQDVFRALLDFLTLVLPVNTEIVQAQDNRVAMPVGGFVAMTHKSSERLSTNVVSYTDPGSNPGSKSALTPSKYIIQLDFYGVDSMKWATMVQALFRDSYGFDNFPSNIKPLYADDPIQIPLINGEHQYEQRWKLDAVMQINPVVTVSQDFAAALSASLVPVERTYPA